MTSDKFGNIKRICLKASLCGLDALTLCAGSTIFSLFEPEHCQVHCVYQELMYKILLHSVIDAFIYQNLISYTKRAIRWIKQLNISTAVKYLRRRSDLLSPNLIDQSSCRILTTHALHSHI